GGGGAGWGAGGRRGAWALRGAAAVGAAAAARPAERGRVARAGRRAAAAARPDAARCRAHPDRGGPVPPAPAAWSARLLAAVRAALHAPCAWARAQAPRLRIRDRGARRCG